jgi:hypothetical protein
MADERGPNAGPSEEGVIVNQGEKPGDPSEEGIIAPQGEQPGGPSESTEGIIVNQAEEPAGDEPPKKDGIVIDY